MTKSETSNQDPSLTEVKDLQESKGQVSEPGEENKDLPEGAKNWQHAIQLAREREQRLQEEKEEIARKLADKEAAEKKRRMEEMSETDRYKAMAEEESAKRGKLELQLIVKDAIAGKKLPKAIEDLIVKTPWAIPAVADELGSEFTWDQAVDSVKHHLQGFVDSLVVQDDTKPLTEEPSRRVDSERSVDTAVVRDHIYTREEIEKLSRDPQEWEKHRPKILKQLAAHGGRLPQY